MPEKAGNSGLGLFKGKKEEIFFAQICYLIY